MNEETYAYLVLAKFDKQNDAEAQFTAIGAVLKKMRAIQLVTTSNDKSMVAALVKSDLPAWEIHNRVMDAVQSWDRVAVFEVSGGSAPNLSRVDWWLTKNTAKPRR